jgi:hypothetical protein
MTIAPAIDAIADQLDLDLEALGVTPAQRANAVAEVRHLRASSTHFETRPHAAEESRSA